MFENGRTLHVSAAIICKVKDVNRLSFSSSDKFSKRNVEAK